MRASTLLSSRELAFQLQLVGQESFVNNPRVPLMHSGIPDFRGPEGVWTRRAQGRQPTGGISTLQAIPTPTHMALLQLQNSGILKYTISQNCDGLHRRSGILPVRCLLPLLALLDDSMADSYPQDNISELHGNNNREYCKDCGKEFIRGM